MLYTADEFCVDLDFRLDGQKTQTQFNQLCASSMNEFYGYINCNLIHSQRDLQTIGAKIYQAEHELANKRIYRMESFTTRFQCGML